MGVKYEAAWSARDVIRDLRSKFGRNRGWQGDRRRWDEHLHRFTHKLNNIVNTLLIL
jgi:hypothetical protein